MRLNNLTACSRDIGDELRRLREQNTTLSCNKMAALLGWDKAKVSTFETGKTRVDEFELMHYLALCGQTKEFIDEFMERYRHAFLPYFAQLPENLRTLALAESTATKITCLDITTVPGLLQTEDYARALFVTTGLSPKDLIEAGVRARLERQKILHPQSRPDCTFFVHENVLRLKIGSDQVMQDQMMRLMFHTHVLRVVPKTAYCAAYKLLEYPKEKPVVYSENDLVQVFAHDSTVIARCKLIFERLDEVAFDEEQSRKLLMDYVNRYDPPREDLDGPGARLAQEQLQRRHRRE